MTHPWVTFRGAARGVGRPGSPLCISDKGSWDGVHDRREWHFILPFSLWGELKSRKLLHEGW